MKAPHAKPIPFVVFQRRGSDVHGGAFEHRLLYAESDGAWRMWVETKGFDLDGVEFSEDWEVVTDVDDVMNLIVQNMYLSISHREFSADVLPALRRLNSVLADDLDVRISEAGAPFSGDVNLS